ncbi:nicotinate (nicotinamide) nucleotide adenylyltransferase [Leptolyngbya sp. 'hensonii']|uniref:nicotinate (nicotinamide) nucleotide adenylyltransferase n=1 Tax=Leptolyngbya sp. 'hensonii' TaxID=1922337 RepID=UPI0009502C69|nr:nicotinate (nicotinamide) nucleotide adenylyltransferase [Leptolyngbya sp. 'hensonii']OLP20162.1 nicotinate (nicotinamide) nucleotide adenylyltransferase [Leptolyngbya sp. 'hensonii']
MKKVAIFGGTFNPIHWGHLLMAEIALTQAELDVVLWVPSSQPPHKVQSELACFEQRLEMVKRAIADHPAFHWSDIEATRAGPSYAIQTLNDLKLYYPDACWAWIVGLDAFQSLPHWYRSSDLIAQCHWLVAPRREKRLEKWDKTLPHSIGYQILDMPQIDLSSSLVRQFCQQGKSIRYLVPEAVRTYIQAYQLYGHFPQRRGKCTLLDE